MEGMEKTGGMSGGTEKREPGRERSREEELDLSVRELYSSVVRFLGKCKEGIGTEESFRELFSSAESILENIGKTVALVDGDYGRAPGSLPQNLIGMFSLATHLIMMAGNRTETPRYIDDPNIPYWIALPSALAGSEETMMLKNGYREKAQSLLRAGFGEWFARTAIGTEKYRYLYSKGIEASVNPLCEIVIGETEQELFGEKTVSPTYEISPSEGVLGDRVIYRPPLGDPLHGMTVSFWVDDISDRDAGNAPEDAFLEVIGYDPDVFDDKEGEEDDTDYRGWFVTEFDPIIGLPEVSEPLVEEFANRILPDFMEMIRDPETRFGNREGYLPVRPDTDDTGFWKIVPSETGYTLES